MSEYTMTINRREHSTLMGVTVPRRRSLLQCLRIRKPDKWRPSYTERRHAITSGRKAIQDHADSGKGLDSQAIAAEVQESVGVSSGTLTAIWIAKIVLMLIQLWISRQSLEQGNR